MGKSNGAARKAKRNVETEAPIVEATEGANVETAPDDTAEIMAKAEAARALAEYEAAMIVARNEDETEAREIAATMQLEADREFEALQAAEAATEAARLASESKPAEAAPVVAGEPAKIDKNKRPERAQYVSAYQERQKALRAKGPQHVIAHKLAEIHGRLSTYAGECETWSETEKSSGATIAGCIAASAHYLALAGEIVASLPADWTPPVKIAAPKAATIDVGTRVIVQEAARADLAEMYGNGFVSSVLIVTAVQNGGIVRVSDGRMTKPVFRAVLAVAPAEA